MADKLCKDLLDGGVVWWECKLMDGDKEWEEGFKGAEFLAKEAKYFVKIGVALGFYVLCKTKFTS
jgi:hypothetical protein